MDIGSKLSNMELNSYFTEWQWGVNVVMSREVCAETDRREGVKICFIGGVLKMQCAKNEGYIY